MKKDEEKITIPTKREELLSVKETLQQDVEAKPQRIQRFEKRKICTTK